MSKTVLHPPTLDEISAAARRIAPYVLRTPLVPLGVDGGPARIFLKPENLQPIGSFKLRPAASALAAVEGDRLEQEGVLTVSSGNMAQGVAWMARRLGVAARVVAARGQVAANKKAALERLGADLREVPFEDFWRLIVDHRLPGLAGYFVHPVANQDVVAGDATVGLEILEDLPDVDTIVVPHGGGGLVSGIASAVKARGSKARVLSCECSLATPVAAALAAGHPVDIAPMKSWIAGISVGPVLADMWPLISALVDGAVAASPQEIAEAVALLMRHNRLLAEGAGAASVAAAMAGRAGGGTVVCVISGGNIDKHHLTAVLQGRTP